MANIQERRDKNGKLISFSIRVHRGRGDDGKQLKPWTETFKVLPKWDEETARKKAAAAAATFEAKCRAGTASDTRLKFAEYTNYVLDLKEQRHQIKHSTLVRYKELTKRIFPEIGRIKLTDLRVHHLNDLYTKLATPGVRHTSDKARAVIDLAAVLEQKHISKAQIARDAGIAASTVRAAVNGDCIGRENAVKIADALGLKFDNAFMVIVENATLSAKTIVEHHRLISTVLQQAATEDLIPYNIASKATLPKVKHKEVNYFQPEQISAIQEALQTEPLKWQTLTHLLIMTGARRGEILGLKWSAVDYATNSIHIENSVLYSSDRGVYEDTPKTETSTRWIALPTETMNLLRRWQREQAVERKRLKGYYIDHGFLFCQDDGQPMRPDCVTQWLNKFAERHDLPHINPHAFRHTMASALIFNKIDDVSLQHRLGHSSADFTKKQYGHLMDGADQRNAEVLSSFFLKKA